MGAIGHQAYLNPQDHRQFQVIDTWDNIEGLQKFLNDPNVAAEFGRLFEGTPEVTVWGDFGWKSF